MTKSQGMPRARLARVAAVLAIVFGVLGMHGLSFHGTAHAGAPEFGTAAHSTPPDLIPAHAKHPSVDTDTEIPSESSTETSPAVGAATPDSDGTGHTLQDMAMLCLATLVVAATLLAMTLCLRRMPRMWAVLPVFVRHMPYRGLIPRGTGPPYTWRFSVIRC